MNLAAPKQRSLAEKGSNPTEIGTCLSRMGRAPQSRRPNDSVPPIAAFAIDVEAGRCFDTHRHDGAQLAYAMTGRMTVATADGEWSIAPQEAVWIAPGVQHGIRMLEAVRFRTLYFEAALAVGMPRTCARLDVTEALRSLILALFIADDGDGAGEAGRLGAALIEALRGALVTPHTPLTPLPSHHRLRALCLAFLEKPDAETTIEEWALRFGMNRRSVSRAFRRELNTTFGAWRRRVIVDEASRQLAAGASVTRVAFDLGYESLSAFTAMFRRISGVVPSQVRRR